jgi:hypothetical protein
MLPDYVTTTYDESKSTDDKTMLIVIPSGSILTDIYIENDTNLICVKLLTDNKIRTLYLENKIGVYKLLD